MRETFRLFLILITLSVILFAWITHQLGNSRIQTLIGILVVGSVVALQCRFFSQREEIGPDLGRRQYQGFGGYPGHQEEVPGQMTPP